MKRQRGFSIVMAIFIIVLLAALGAFAVSIFRVQQSTAMLDEQELRAYQAAQSAANWAAFQLRPLNRPLGTAPAYPLAGCPAVLAGPAPTAVAFPAAAATFANMRAAVTCASSGVQTDGPYSAITFTITATACNNALTPGATCPVTGAPPDGYVQRTVTLSVQN